MDWSPIIAFMVGVMVPLIFTQFLPNEKFYNWGFTLGKSMSRKGKGLVGESWEQAENNFTGSVVAFAQGLKEGADLDDTVKRMTK